MYVVTADQRRSRRQGDRVTSLLSWWPWWAEARAEVIALPLERTVGDEVQAVFTTPDAALEFALHLQGSGQWVSVPVTSTRP